MINIKKALKGIMLNISQVEIGKKKVIIYIKFLVIFSLPLILFFVDH